MLQAVERRQRFVEALPLDRGLGPHNGRLGLCVLVPALPGLEVRDVDAEPLRDPRERFLGRARLPAFDLADVFLREAVAGQLGLRQAGRDAELAEAVA
jgi:hypothetical protein